MSLVLFLIAAGAAVAFAVWTYRRRELPVAGRGALAAIRAAALVLVLALLFDPRLPALSSTSAEARWVLVDGSASMAVGAPGATPWDSAVAAARELERDGWRPLRFGDEPAAGPPDGALAIPPAGARSRLAPALEYAAEAGAREVVVLSDLRLEDPVAVEAALERLGMGVRFVPLGAETVNAGIAELLLPAALESGVGVAGEVVVFASAGVGSDSLLVEVREEERLVFSARVAPPAPGRTARVPFALPAPTAAGEVRYQASVRVAGDGFAGDDAAVAYAVVDPREGMVVAVSFAPDWELRPLLPLLARATGLPARGFLQAGERFVPMGAGGPPLDAAAVAARVRDAELVVLHGLGASSPVWAREAAAGGRVLAFPTDAAGAAALGVSTSPRRAGEWYLSEELPPSPLAGELGGIAFAALPPLTGLLPRAGAEAGPGPLEARLRGIGAPAAPLALVERPQGRAVVALGSGWWRWAARPGPAAEAYGRVWSAAAGWLLAGRASDAGQLRPRSRVNPPGAPIAWSGGVPPLRLTVLAGDSVVTDTTLAASLEGLRTPALSEGSYRWIAAGADSASGRFDVHATSAELRNPRMAPPAPRAELGGDGSRDAAGSGRPLRAHALPWILLLALLCGEWVVRRRRGLR